MGGGQVTTYQKSMVMVGAGLCIILALYLGVDLAAVGRALLWVRDAAGL